VVGKAVIAVAGMGSRFFPIAKSLNKCMLPVLNHPVIAYAVADCLTAGARQLAIVTAEGHTGDQVRHYFSGDPGLEEYFASRGWQARYAAIAGLHRQAEFTFLSQPRDDRYGTAVPAMLAAGFIGDDDFLLLAGDDLLLRADGGSDLADLAAARESAGLPAAIAAATVPGSQAHHFGVLSSRTTAAGHQILATITEKPASCPQPTAHISISRALLPASSLAYFGKLQPAASGEYQTTDAINAYAADNDVLIWPVQGHYYDCGNPAGWLAANNAAAQHHIASTPRDPAAARKAHRP
jgi:UTP--glucose-1-phosphate uridylyltransferase